MLERAKACGPIVFAAMREDIIEVAVELGLNSGDPQAVAVARELAEASADADSPLIDDAREGSLSDQRCLLRSLERRHPRHQTYPVGNRLCLATITRIVVRPVSRDRPLSGRRSSPRWIIPTSSSTVASALAIERISVLLRSQ